MKRGSNLKRVPLLRASALEPSGRWTRSVPLLSRSPLRPAGTLERDTVSRPRSAARAGGGSGGLVPPAPPEFTDRVKRLVRKRAGRGDIHEAQCEACGCWLGRDAGEFQRRAARGAGGCRDTVIGGCANCALMCPPCRRRAEDRDEHMGMGAGGFWIRHGTAPEYDPRNVPIMLYGKRAGGGEITVWLAAGGKGPDGTGYLYQCPEVE